MNKELCTAIQTSITLQVATLVEAEDYPSLERLFKLSNFGPQHAAELLATPEATHVVHVGATKGTDELLELLVRTKRISTYSDEHLKVQRVLLERTQPERTSYEKIEVVYLSQSIFGFTREMRIDEVEIAGSILKLVPCDPDVMALLTLNDTATKDRLSVYFAGRRSKENEVLCISEGDYFINGAHRSRLGYARFSGGTSANDTKWAFQIAKY